MDDADDLGRPPMPIMEGSAVRAPGEDICVPASLAAYLATRTDDVAGAVRSLSSSMRFPGLWMPVFDAVAASAALSSCRFDAALLLRVKRGGLSAVITAGTWSVTLIGHEAWVDVEWPSEAWATALQGLPLRGQIDFPFLSEALMVLGHEPFDRYRRFHCREGGCGSAEARSIVPRLVVVD